MSRTTRRSGSNKRNQRRVSVRAVRRAHPDSVQISRALITFALEQAAQEAAAEADQKRRQREPRHG